MSDASTMDLFRACIHGKADAVRELLLSGVDPNELMYDGRHPLFVEELTKAIVESGALSETADGFAPRGDIAKLSIPASLQASPHPVVRSLLDSCL